MKIIDNNVFFYKNFLSQWHRSDFYDIQTGIIFPYAEKYMMFYKALLFNDLEIADLILKAEHPREDQKLGRLINNFKQPIWDKYKINIVYNANIYKFSQNPLLMKKILAFEDNVLFVEASPTDLVWGIGLDENDENLNDKTKWRGENNLGEVLTVVKFHLTHRHYTEPKYCGIEDSTFKIIKQKYK